MTTKRISLCAVPYDVTDADGQVIFEDRSGFFGLEGRFTFEWKGCGWYLVDFEDSFEKIFVPHIVAALEWVNANYPVEWIDGVGKVNLLTESP